MLAAYPALAGDVDIIHDHTGLGPLLAGQRGIARQPVVTTIHGQVTAQVRRRPAQATRHASIVAISHAYTRSFGGIPVAAVIHHGIDLDIHKADPGTAVTCCSSAACLPTRVCIARCGSPGGPAPERTGTGAP